MEQDGNDVANQPAGTPGTELLRLPPSLRIEEVEVRRELLLRRLGDPGPVLIDVSGLNSVDTAGVQLLLACRREAERRAMQIEFCGESPELFGALRLLGLTEAVLGRRI